jgi:transcription elongation factor GreA
MTEKISQSNINYLTWKTKIILEKKIQSLEARELEVSKSAGEAAGSSSDWHDNPAYDQAVLDVHFLASQILIYQGKLLDAVIIESRTNTEFIDVGNDVIVQFEDEDVPERFSLLGELDVIVGEVDAVSKSTNISHQSPLGRELIGKKKGDIVLLKINDVIRKVKILSVLPSSFETKTD